MADFLFSLTAAPVLGGADVRIAANRIVERADLALISVATPLGDEATLAKALLDGWNLAQPGPRVSTTNGVCRAVRTSPDQLMLVFPHETPDANTVVQKRLNGAGYTTDQTDAWVALEIEGPHTLAALERLCPLDLDPAAFPVDASARTVMEHMGAMIVRLDDDRFLLMSASSSARSFLHAVETSYRYVIA